MIHLDITREEALAEVRKDLTPIMDVFGGVDGGVSYSRLHHGFLNEMYSKKYPTEAEAALIKMVKQFSRLCALMLEK